MAMLPHLGKLSECHRPYFFSNLVDYQSCHLLKNLKWKPQLTNWILMLLETMRKQHTCLFPDHFLQTMISRSSFLDTFHGSVPSSTRQKVCEMALKNHKLSVNHSELKLEQRSDPYFSDTIYRLEHQIVLPKGILSPDENYCMNSDLLFSLPIPQDIKMIAHLRLQLVVLESLAAVVISAKHDKFQGSGHAGFLRSLLAIKRKYYIHDLANKLRDYINKCGLCLKLRNSKKTNIGVPLRQEAGQSCNRPFENIQLDFCGPIPRKCCSKYIFACDMWIFWFYLAFCYGHHRHSENLHLPQ